ncbi:AAA family ATPase [Streptacidiphilus cavernicola]|uniref:AAA family ATPase n=1 Tax=Streptacidiphilus cavernicola TaxID=3342716 RepID=A0ABV6VR11_9ACTN
MAAVLGDRHRLPPLHRPYHPGCLLVQFPHGGLHTASVLRRTTPGPPAGAGSRRGYAGPVTRQRGTVVLMCGLPGAGKTTYARGLVRRGYARLSIDEAVWERLGRRDAGLVLEPEAYDRLKDEVRREQRQELVALMRAGRDVVVDYSFWSRAHRDDYKALVESHGCRWELVHLKADRATLERRVKARNDEDGANSVTVEEQLLNRYLAAFEEPSGEGEQVVVQPPE